MTCTFLRGVCRGLMEEEQKEGEKDSDHGHNHVFERNDDDNTLLLLPHGTG